MMSTVLDLCASGVFDAYVAEYCEYQDLAKVENAHMMFKASEKAWHRCAKATLPSIELGTLTTAAVAGYKRLIAEMEAPVVHVSGGPINVALGDNMNRMLDRVGQYKRMLTNHVARGGNKAAIVASNLTFSGRVVEFATGGREKKMQVSKTMTVRMQDIANGWKADGLVDIRVGIVDGAQAFISSNVRACCSAQGDAGGSGNSFYNSCPSFYVSLHVMGAGGKLVLHDVPFIANGKWFKASGLCLLSPRADREHTQTVVLCLRDITKPVGMMDRKASQADALHLDRVRS